MCERNNSAKILPAACVTKKDFSLEINKYIRDKRYQEAFVLNQDAKSKFSKNYLFISKDPYIYINLKKYKEAHASFMVMFNGFFRHITVRDFDVFFENALRLIKKDSGIVFRDAERIFSLFKDTGWCSVKVDIFEASLWVVKRCYRVAVDKMDYYLSKGLSLKRVNIVLYIRALFQLFEFKKMDIFLKSDLALPLGEFLLKKERKRSELLLSLTSSEVLSENNNYRMVVFRQNNPKGVFVTFGTAAGHLDDDPFGLDFILGYGYDLIFIAQNNKTRYQLLSVDTFESIVAPVIESSQYKNVYTYGVSLGGYCAIYYSGCIDATAIAASPLNPWDISLSNYVNQQIVQKKPLSYSYNLPYKQRHSRFKDIKKSAKKHFIFYDSKIEMDRIFIENQILPVFKNSKVLAINHGSHYLLTFLQKLKVLKPFLVSIIEDGEFMDLSHIDFESSAIWNFQKGKWLLEERIDYMAGITYLNKSISLEPSKQAKEILEKYVSINE